MSGQSTVLKWDLLRSVDSSTIGTESYTTLGSPITYPARIVKIINNSTTDVTISVDGINDYDFVPATGFVLYDCGTNRGNSSPEMAIQQGTQILVKGSAGTGLIYLVVLYAYTNQGTLPGE